MVALEEQLATNIRQDLVDALRQALQAKLYAKTVDRTCAVDEPERGEDPTEWSVLLVITRRQWTDILFDVFDEPLPPADESTAEVRTPATVLVWAFCPRCKLPAAIRLHVEPVLMIDSNGSQLKLKASSKATYHVCGQQTLPTKPEEVADGQAELPLEDASEVDDVVNLGPEEVEQLRSELDAVDPAAAIPPQDTVDAPPAVEWCPAVVDGKQCGLQADHVGDHDPDALPF